MSVEIAVPAYFHPAVAGAEWKILAVSAGAVSALILNIDSGPGVRPEPSLLAAATCVAAAGLPVLGYIDSAYGLRPLAEIAADMGRYRSWYPVTGYFLDQAAASAEHLGLYAGAVQHAAALGSTRTVLNHGVYPDRQYASLGAELGTFEGPWSAYTSVTVPAWASDLPAGRCWHLVYDTPASALGDVLGRAQHAGAGTVYVTDGRGANPWGGLPSYFGALTGAVRFSG